MSHNMKVLCSNTLLKRWRNFPRLNFSTSPREKVERPKHKQEPIISCKKASLNYYGTESYSKLEEIHLASKGWGHNKSKGDYFVINGDPEDIDPPSIPFSTLVDSRLLDVLAEENVREATSFQAEVIPIIGSGKHTLIAAETGCGKTYSYLLPLIQKLIGNPCEELNTPRIVILVPNRELAYQIGTVAEHLAKPFDLKVKILVGGQTKKLMMNPDFHNVDILVGTPGVIGKLSTVGVYKFNEVRQIVLDEADTLLDDSFVERMEGIFRKVPQAQVVLVSATFPRTLPVFLEPILNSIQQVKSDRLHKPLRNVTQKFLRLSKSSKPSQLLAIASKTKHPTIVFTNRNESSNWLAMFLRENKVPCANINGDMNYGIRIQQWTDFLKGKSQFLSATDVGSRGLDMTEVRHIVNYDFPFYAADYIHRIGRIGRLSSQGNCKVTNFISGGIEIKLVQNIEMAIRTNSELKNVDGNITNIVQKKILNKINY